jgi:hypothetical protein
MVTATADATAIAASGHTQARHQPERACRCDLISEATCDTFWNLAKRNLVVLAEGMPRTITVTPAARSMPKAVAPTVKRVEEQTCAGASTPLNFTTTAPATKPWPVTVTSGPLALSTWTGAIPVDHRRHRRAQVRLRLRHRGQRQTSGTFSLKPAMHFRMRWSTVATFGRGSTAAREGSPTWFLRPPQKAGDAR